MQPKYRKFTAFIITIVLFTTIIIIRPGVDILSLGFAMTGILAAFAAPNALEKFANRGNYEKQD